MSKTVEAAQQFNAERMTTEKLRDELRLVSSFEEQPPIRVRYLEQLRAELARREELSDISPDPPDPPDPVES